MTIDIEPLRKQLGRKIEDEDVVTQAPLKAMIATFDRQEKAPEEGEPIAPGWHLCFLHSYARPAQLGRDGAAFTGGVLPEIPMPRRMYAGSTFTFDGDIRVGDKLKREIEFSDIQLRQGSTGTLIVTTQTRRIFTPRGLALTEAASTVFREDPKPGEKSGMPVREAAPADVPWRRTITPGPVMLFRYSAITFNPHRIHYDRTYCMETEGYPGLVVHGPFAQQCIFDLLRNSTPGRTIKTFAVRARAPLFDTAPFDVIGRPTADGKGAELWTVTPKGTIAAQATATSRLGPGRPQAILPAIWVNPSATDRRSDPPARRADGAARAIAAAHGRHAARPAGEEDRVDRGGAEARRRDAIARRRVEPIGPRFDGAVEIGARRRDREARLEKGQRHGHMVLGAQRDLARPPRQTPGDGRAGAAPSSAGVPLSRARTPAGPARRARARSCRCRRS